jgi:hypothetical protein
MQNPYAVHSFLTLPAPNYDFTKTLKSVVIGAAESSLDVAGTALVPGAWPIVKGALAPCSIA